MARHRRYVPRAMVTTAIIARIGLVSAIFENDLAISMNSSDRFLASHELTDSSQRLNPDASCVDMRPLPTTASTPMRTAKLAMTLRAMVLASGTVANGSSGVVTLSRVIGS